ncbi:MAG: hypothetical protein AAFX04_06540 [Pseudomonadota bacterium]
MTDKSRAPHKAASPQAQEPHDANAVPTTGAPEAEVPVSEHAGAHAANATSQQENADSTASEKPGLIEQATGLYGDARTWLDSELDFQKGRVAYTTRAAKLAAIFTGVGLVTLLCALITLLLGIFMTVIYYFGPLIALLTVPPLWGLLGWLALRQARARVRDAADMIAETGGVTGHKSDTGEQPGGDGHG